MGGGPAPRGRRALRIGAWASHNPKVIRDSVNRTVRQAKHARFPLAQPVRDLAKLIYDSPAVYMLFTQMLTEVPNDPRFDKDPSNQPEIRDVVTLLETINHQIHSPIKFNDSSLMGAPLNALLAWPMATKAGYAVFLRDDVNACFEKILRYWADFLVQPASRETVTTADGGWLSLSAQRDPDSPGLRDFLKTYVVPDPNDGVHYGFRSWDDFFTRKFRPGVRPVADPHDSKVVVSACESTPFAIQTNVQLQDTFWAKNQHYSLTHLLGDGQMAEHFVGGTVYQAYLSADAYHNWHAPVSGKFLRRPHIVPGTFFSESLIFSFSPDDESVPFPDPADERSQGYIACVARRGVAYIQPDDESLGLIAVVMIGMGEVSSIEFDDLDHFDKGDEIGRFHYGGSTHCVVFGPGVTFEPEKIARPVDPTHYDLSQAVVPLCSKLGTLRPVASC